MTAPAIALLLASFAAWHRPPDPAITLVFQPLPVCTMQQVGWAFIETQTIVINTTCHLPEWQLQALVTHELGHILRRDTWHSADKHSVMFWKVGRGQAVKLEELSEITASK